MRVVNVRIKKVRGKLVDVGSDEIREIVVRSSGVDYAIPFGDIENLPKENAVQWLKSLDDGIVVFNFDSGKLARDSY